ncbi:MAG TPA: hypothetical protein VK486_08485 [Thermoleophilaceae bacterium]|nr:hypothetical protein [Thermoleophilaceae bacterium]
MSEPLPIACTLSAANLRARGEELRALGGDGLVDATEEAGRAVLRFRPEPSIRKRVEAAVAAESECCAFLDFELEAGEDATVLTISAPNGGAEMVHELTVALADR